MLKNGRQDVKFKKGKFYIVEGNSKKVNYLVHKLSVDLVNKKIKVLIIDTTNSLNPHHIVFNNYKQTEYLKHIYCVRTPMPYDLYARLNTSYSYINKMKIGALIISSLSYIFKEYNKTEIDPIIYNILTILEKLTQRNNLITIIGNSSGRDKSVKHAYNIVSTKIFQEVK